MEELRKIYAERQQHLNAINQKREYDLNKLEDLKAKIEELERKIEELSKKKNELQPKYDAKIASSEEEVLELAKLGYDCQPIGKGKWLMKRPTNFNL